MILQKESYMKCCLNFVYPIPNILQIFWLSKKAWLRIRINVQFVMQKFFTHFFGFYKKLAQEYIRCWKKYSLWIYSSLFQGYFPLQWKYERRWISVTLEAWVRRGDHLSSGSAQFPWLPSWVWTWLDLQVYDTSSGTRLRRGNLWWFIPTRERKYVIF